MEINNSDLLLKIDNSVYRINVKSTFIGENENLNVCLKDEGSKVWSLDADLTTLIDLDKNWKKFDISEIKDLVLECVKSSKYSVNFNDKAAHIKLKTIFASKEVELNLKLNLKEEKENDKTTESEILALLKRIELLETKKKFQLIFRPGHHGWGFKFEGNLELKFTSDV
jgi:hypothetical protein